MRCSSATRAACHITILVSSLIIEPTRHDSLWSIGRIPFELIRANADASFEIIDDRLDREWSYENDDSLCG